MENGKQEAFGFAAQLDGENIYSAGLTKREYFAAMAMQGLMTTLIPLTDNQLCPNYDNVKYCANLAATAADELLKALETKSE